MQEPNRLQQLAIWLICPDHHLGDLEDPNLMIKLQYTSKSFG